MSMKIITDLEALQIFSQDLTDRVEELREILTQTENAINETAKGWKDPKFQSFCERFEDDKTFVNQLCDEIDSCNQDEIMRRIGIVSRYLELPKINTTDTSYRMLDVGAFQQFQKDLNTTGESTQKVLEGVDHYVQGVLEELKRHIDIIKEKVEDAREDLRDAEAALSACRESQEYDEESGEYKPSCNCEERDVERSEAILNEWENRFKQAEGVYSEVERETNDYYAMPDFLYQGGGDYVLTDLAGRHTTEAISAMDSIIDVSSEYLGTDVREIESELDDDSFQESISNNRQAMVEELAKFNPPVSDAVVICDVCGRPKYICTCQHDRTDC